MGAQPEFEIPPFASFTKTWHNDSYPAISPTQPALSAAGKHVVVTGGGTGIGASIALSFAKAGAASVSILGRREDRLKKSTAAISDAAHSATKVLYEVADLTNGADVRRAIDSIASRVGDKISIFVANAGSIPTMGPLATDDVDAFMRGFDMNVRTILNSLQAFIPNAVAEDPVLINISTGMVHIDAIAGMASYSSSKAAGTKLVEYFAKENPSWRVYNVQPGVVKTEMNDDLAMEGQDDVALPGHFCVWLASPEGRFLKGKYVWVNWDVEELKAKAKEIQETRVLTIMLDGVPM
ncbi:hypothetical protein MMC25_008167 [Agyrium rufum]|nr:hypothetical protein [Agyrium rufum]